MTAFEQLIAERSYMKIASLLVCDPLPATSAEAIIDDSCFSAIEYSRQGLAALAALGLSAIPRTRAVDQLLTIATLALNDELHAATKASLDVDRRSLKSSLLLALRIALHSNDVPRARECARMLADVHPKREKAHPDLAALLQWREPAPAQSNQHRVVICSSLKDEAEYLEEWVRYHASIGIEHFYLYNNASTDGTQDILDRLSTEFSMTVHFISEQPGQRIAFNHFLEHHASKAQWACMIDGDEFLNLESAHSVLDVLAGFDEASAVACSWMNFGSGGHERVPAGPCVEAFTWRAAQRNPHVKCIVRPERVIRMMNPHQYLVTGNVVDGSGNPVLVFQGKINPPAKDLIRINHYITKSKDQWTRKKMRGRPLPSDSPRKLRTDAYFLENDRNEVEDTSIWRLSRLVSGRTKVS